VERAVCVGSPSKPRREDAIRNTEPEPHLVDHKHRAGEGDVDDFAEGICSFLCYLNLGVFVIILTESALPVQC